MEKLILTAIGRGVPLYNSGDAQACARVYHDCARDLVRDGALNSGSSSKLLAALEATGPGAHLGADECAWLLRHTLDDVLERLRGDGGAPEDGVNGERLPFRFAAQRWQSVDDRVMGGRSMSRMVAAGQDGVFEGELVVQGGGFASVRCALQQSFGGATGVAVRYTGDGRRGYKLTFKTDSALDGVSWQIALPAASTEQTVRLPFAQFQPTFRGQVVRNVAPLRGEDVMTLGVMLSRYEAGAQDASVAAGSFRLRLSTLEPYRG